MFRTRKVKEFALVVIMAYVVAWSVKGITFATASKSVQPITAGEPFLLDKGMLSGARDLVIVTSDRCPYSRASEDFHKRLIDTAHRLRVPLLVLTDAKVSIPSGISSSLAGNDHIVRTDLRALGIVGTPTVLLIEGGTVTGSWVGLINEQQEKGLLARLDESFHTLTMVADSIQVLQLKPNEMAARLGSSHVLDIRTRDKFRTSHLQDAENIPSDELGARMQIELHEDGRPVVIDCRATDMGICLGDAKLLQWNGLKQVWLFDAGAVGSACSMTRM